MVSETEMVRETVNEMSVDMKISLKFSSIMTENDTLKKR